MEAAGVMTKGFVEAVFLPVPLSSLKEIGIKLGGVVSSTKSYTLQRKAPHIDLPVKGNAPLSFRFVFEFINHL